MVDTVFNDRMQPVFVDDPEVVKRRLRAPYAENWSKVLIGSTGQVVPIAEYLYQETFNEVRSMLEVILKKQNLPMYQRSPERLEIYLVAMTRRIIERVLNLNE